MLADFWANHAHHAHHATDAGARRRCGLGLRPQLTDEALDARLYRPPVPRPSHQIEPDYAWIHPVEW